MLRRSGKIQFLFWIFFFSVMVYLWLIAIGLQTFVLPDEKPMHMPQDTVALMFVLYGFLVILSLGGTVLSIMINNRHYTRLFGGLVILVFGTIIAAKGIFG